MQEPIKPMSILMVFGLLDSAAFWRNPEVVYFGSDIGILRFENYKFNFAVPLKGTKEWKCTHAGFLFAKTIEKSVGEYLVRYYYWFSQFFGANKLFVITEDEINKVCKDLNTYIIVAANLEEYVQKDKNGTDDPTFSNVWRVNTIEDLKFKRHFKTPESPIRTIELEPRMADLISDMSLTFINSILFATSKDGFGIALPF